MKIITRPRQAGKTHEMVQWVLEGEAVQGYPGWSRVLVCHTIQEADRIRVLYPALGYRQVFSWQEWRERHPGGYPTNIAVDNAELILAQVLGQWPSVVSMTGGE